MALSALWYPAGEERDLRDANVVETVFGERQRGGGGTMDETKTWWKNERKK